MTKFSTNWTLREIRGTDGDDGPNYRIEADSTLFLDIVPNSDGYSPGENEANAFLIVTAPRLYKTIERMLVLLRIADFNREYGVTSLIHEGEQLLQEAREGPPDGCSL